MRDNESPPPIDTIELVGSCVMLLLFLLIALFG